MFGTRLRTNTGRSEPPLVGCWPHAGLKITLGLSSIRSHDGWQPVTRATYLGSINGSNFAIILRPGVSTDHMHLIRRQGVHCLPLPLTRSPIEQPTALSIITIIGKFAANRCIEVQNAPLSCIVQIEPTIKVLLSDQKLLPRRRCFAYQALNTMHVTVGGM